MKYSYRDYLIGQIDYTKKVLLDLLAVLDEGYSDEVPDDYLYVVYALHNMEFERE